MRNNKQTAVEWLVEKLQNRQNGIFKGIHYMSLDEIYNLAKAIEKQQSLELIELTAQLTGVATVDNEISKMEFIDVYKQYYNQEYGGNK